MSARHASVDICVWTPIAVALLLAPGAHAEPQAPPSESGGSQSNSAKPLDIWLEVNRDPGSEACPDADSIFRAIRTEHPNSSIRRASDPSKSAAQAEIDIRPSSVGHEAHLTVTHPQRGERSIEENDVNCRGLASALALHLKLFGDTLPPPPQRREENAPMQPGPKSFRADANASAVAGYGLLSSESALGVAVGLDLFHRSGWGISLQGLRLWAAEVRGQGGTIALTLWAGIFGPCYRQGVSDASSLDLCLRFGAGSQQAEVAGFVHSRTSSYDWMVLGPVARYDQGLGRFLNAFVGAGAVVQVLPQSFELTSPDGKNTTQVVSNPRFGLMAELGLAVGSDVF